MGCARGGSERLVGRVVIRCNLPDGMGLVGRRKDATRSLVLQGRDPRSIRVLIPDGRGPDQNIHDVTIVDISRLNGPYTGWSRCAKGNQESQLTKAFPSMDSYTRTVCRIPVGSTFGHFE